MSLTVTVQPVLEALLVEEAMAHLRLDSNDEIPLVTTLITAARQQVENMTGRALLTQTLALTLDAFPFGGWGQWQTRRDGIALPRPVLQSVTSVTYVDQTGTLTTLPTTGYQVVSKSEPGSLVPAYGSFWPVTRWQPEAVTITYKVGWTTPSLVPVPIKQAMLLFIGHYYENREAVTIGTSGAGTILPLAVQSLLLPYTVLEAA